MLRRYRLLGIAMNEMNQAMGLIDYVPEISIPPVLDKAALIHRLQREAAAQYG